MHASPAPAKRTFRRIRRAVAPMGMFFGVAACEAETLSLLTSEAVSENAGAGGKTASGGQPPIALPDATPPPPEAATPPEASVPYERDGATPRHECTDSRDCDGRRSHCEVTTGSCVQCLLPAHCGFPATCDPVARRCAPHCHSDWDCPPEWGHCALDRGVCIQCTSDAQCPAPFARYCDVVPGACVGCLADFQCPEQISVCHPDRRECVQCRDDTRCPPGARCDEHEGRCFFGP